MAEVIRRGLTLRDRSAVAPISFREFVSKVNPRYKWYRHCEVLASVLQRVADGELKRLLVSMPPRHSKSETISRLFTAYYLHRYPDRWVGVNSYGAELAYTLSRSARENYGRAGGPVADNASAVKHWETGKGGGMWAAGVGGPITGKGFHLAVIDDPLKNAEEAASDVVRSSQKDWYGSTFYTRGEPGAATVVVQTRWHEDDLTGWLLAQESEDDEAERWHVVNLEAIKELDPIELPPSCTLEPDWREPGEALCPERYPLATLRKIASRIGSYFFTALYQGRPRPREGNFFKLSWFARYVDTPPARRDGVVRAWDKAATDGAGDWTAGVKMSRVGDTYYIEDVVRGQWSPGTRDLTILATAARDGRIVPIRGEQEPGAAGKSDAVAFQNLLVGYDARSDPASGDKTVRAGAFASQCEAGHVVLVRGAWNRAYLDELTSFPTGTHDDQVDASSHAFNAIAEDATRVLRARPNPIAGYRG